MSKIVIIKKPSILGTKLNPGCVEVHTSGPFPNSEYLQQILEE